MNAGLFVLIIFTVGAIIGGVVALHLIKDHY